MRSVFATLQGVHSNRSKASDLLSIEGAVEKLTGLAQDEASDFKGFAKVVLTSLGIPGFTILTGANAHAAREAAVAAAANAQE